MSQRQEYLKDDGGPSRRTRVLALAYQCNPAMVSEPRVVFEWLLRLQEVADVTIVTHDRNQRAIEDDGRLRCKLVFVPADGKSAKLWALNRRLFGADIRRRGLPLAVAQYVVYERIRIALFARNPRLWDVDLVHRFSPKCLWWPTWELARGVPFIIGPVNSGMRWPSGVRGLLQRGADILDRTLGNALVSSAGTYARRASRILVTNDVCARSLPATLRRNCCLMPDAAAQDCEAPRLESHAARGPQQRLSPLKLLFVGRLVPLKGVDLLLQALSLCMAFEWELSIAGTGDLLEIYRGQALELGIGARVRFLGRLQHSEVLQLLDCSDVFTFLSLKESGGNVLYEAASAGLPIVAVDYGGPGLLLDRHCAWLIKPISREHIVRECAAGLGRLSASPELRLEMGKRASERARVVHSWSARMRQLERVYQSVLQSRSHEQRIRARN